MAFKLFLFVLSGYCILSEELLATDPNDVHQWFDNLELKSVALPETPTDDIALMKTRETHKFVYYGLKDGQIAIGNANYFGYLSYINVVPVGQTGKIIDFIPIYREILVVLLQIQNAYLLVFIKLLYSEFNVESDGIYHQIHLENPVCMHFSDNRNELLFVHYNSAEINHLSIITPSTESSWEHFLTKDIPIQMEIFLDPDDRFYLTETENELSYILTTNTGCNGVFQLKRSTSNWVISQLDLTANSWSLVPKAFRSAYLYSPHLEYVSASCLLYLNYFEDDHIISIPSNWIQAALQKHDIDINSIEAATMIQRGIDIGALFVINKELMYLGGIAPLQSERSSTISSHGISSISSMSQSDSLAYSVSPVTPVAYHDNHRKLLMAKYKPNAEIFAPPEEFAWDARNRRYVRVNKPKDTPIDTDPPPRKLDQAFQDGIPLEALPPRPQRKTKNDGYQKQRDRRTHIPPTRQIITGIADMSPVPAPTSKKPNMNELAPDAQLKIDLPQIGVRPKPRRPPPPPPKDETPELGLPKIPIQQGIIKDLPPTAPDPPLAPRNRNAKKPLPNGLIDLGVPAMPLPKGRIPEVVEWDGITDPELDAIIARFEAENGPKIQQQNDNSPKVEIEDLQTKAPPRRGRVNQPTQPIPIQPHIAAGRDYVQHRLRRSRTPGVRPTVVRRPGSKEYPLEPLQCWKKRLEMGQACYIKRYRYDIIKKLGSGADGDVFLAKQQLSNDQTRDVALKQFTKQSSFQREYRMLSVLKDCPYATHLIDISPEMDEYGVVAKYFIIVMDYVLGGDLRKFMAKPHESVKADLPIAILRRYLLDLSEPLSIMNDNLNFMHTDLKPENILVFMPIGGQGYGDDEPNIDFILADMSVSMSYDQFRAGSYSGTAYWFSPEMASAAHAHIHRMRSKECVDGYGLVLVGIHLYGSLCNPRGHTDPLCNLAKKFEQAMRTFGNDYARSQATSSALSLLKQQAIHPQASFGYLKAWKLLQICSEFLIRYPDYAKTYPYVSSAPYSCTTWPKFRERILAAK